MINLFCLLFQNAPLNPEKVPILPTWVTDNRTNPGKPWGVDINVK